MLVQLFIIQMMICSNLNSANLKYFKKNSKCVSTKFCTLIIEIFRTGSVQTMLTPTRQTSTKEGEFVFAPGTPVRAESSQNSTAPPRMARDDFEKTKSGLKAFASSLKNKTIGIFAKK